MNPKLFLILPLMVFLLPTAFAQTEPIPEPIFNAMEILPDGTILKDGVEVIFVKTWQLTQTDEIIQVQLETGKVVFQKDSGAVTVFDENEIVIKSDSYVVRGAELNTDIWSNLSVNDVPVTFTIEETPYNAIITFTKENDEGKFDVETVIGNEHSKTTAKFTNYIYENYKFAFTETLDFPDNLIKLNSQDIDLTLYAGQSFPREVLEENMDLVLEAKEVYFNAGLGFEYLWQVNISADNKVSLDWANVGERLTEIGETVELDPSYSFTIGTGTSGSANNQFFHPRGVVTDSNGNIYVADGNNHRVQKFNSSGTYLSTIGTTGSAGATNLTFNNPYSVAVDSSDNLYVADTTNNRVQKFNSSGTYLMTFSNSSMSNPRGVEIDSSGNVWVASYLTHKVLKFNSSGSLVLTIGTGSSGTGNTELYRPMDIAFDSSGNTYVLDMYNHRVQKFNSAGTFQSTFTTGLNYPNGLAIDPTNNNVVVSNTNSQNVKEYNSSGTLLQTYTGFSYPSQVHMDSIGSMYVVDRVNYRVQVYLNIIAPSAPTNLVASQSVANQIALNWTAPSSGSVPTSYEVYLNSTLIDTIGNVTTYTDNITGAEIGAGLTYYVKAINSAGSGSSGTSFITAWDVPSVVTGFQAVTANPITMSWVTPLSDMTITNFKIYRDGTLLTTLGNVNSYTDSATVAGTSYVYTASAVSAVGEGSQSSSSTAIHGVAPDAPTNLTSVINNPNPSPLTISLNWDAPLNFGSAGSLSGYEVYRDGIQIATIGVTSLYNDTVPNSGTFVYTTKAISAHGTSVDSNSSSITTPTQPTSSSTTLAINNPNPNPLDITATFVVPTSDGGSAVTGYNLFSSPDDITYTQVATGVTTPQTITVANAGTWYFKSQAINNVGTGVTGSAVSITTATIPGTINDLLTTPISQTQIDLTWSTPSNGGSNIVDYTIFRDGVLVGTVLTPGFSDVLLTQQTSYDYTVYARNNVGTSLVSNVMTQVTDGVPGVVSLTATTAAIDQINLTWTEPNNYNSAITSYIIERESPTGGGFTTLTTLGSVLSYSDGSLSAVTEYNYRITAVNSYGNGATSTSSAITLPAPPTNVVATPSASTSELVITWNPPTLTTGITGYDIFREDGIGTGFSLITTITGVTFTDTGLSPNIYYNYKLTSVTVQGDSVYSNTYSQTTFNLPDPVTTLTATAGVLIDASLSWSAPTIPYASVTEYNIYQSIVVGTPTILIDTVSPSTLTYTATNLDPTITYYWMVAPVTIHGTNTTGNVANATATSEIIIGSIVVSDDVNPIQLPILFNEVRNGNSTALTVTYATGTNLACDFDNKFARTTTTHDNLAETYVSGTKSSHTFTFNDSSKEIISVHCYDKAINIDGTLLNDETDGVYQINFAEQPIVTQVNDFQKGAFGISSGFGAFDLMTIFVVLISMVGFNRKSPAVGVGVMVAFIGAMAYFGVIETPTVVMGAIAVVVVLAIGQARKER